MLNLKKEILSIFSQANHKKSPEAEANLILIYSFKSAYPYIEKLSDITMTPSPEITAMAINMANERVKGTPLQHITQNQFFFEHDYGVNNHVLIPRPETEILLTEALKYIQNNFKEKPFRFFELGLGSGILSAELLSRFRQATGIASEVSHQAIAIARSNLDRTLNSSNWDTRFSIIEPADTHIGFEVFEDYTPADLIISNPPYVSVHDEIEEEVLKHEPHLALFPSLGGLGLEKENPSFFYENFLYHHKKIMKPTGMAFFEVPHERAQAIAHEFNNANFQVNLIHDLTNRPRVLIAKLWKN